VKTEKEFDSLLRETFQAIHADDGPGLPFPDFVERARGRDEPKTFSAPLLFAGAAVLSILLFFLVPATSPPASPQDGVPPPLFRTTSRLLLASLRDLSPAADPFWNAGPQEKSEGLGAPPLPAWLLDKEAFRLDLLMPDRSE